jgi:hypothetical protein
MEPIVAVFPHPSDASHQNPVEVPGNSVPGVPLVHLELTEEEAGELLTLSLNSMHRESPAGLSALKKLAYALGALERQEPERRQAA